MAEDRRSSSGTGVGTATGPARFRWAADRPALPPVDEGHAPHLTAVRNLGLEGVVDLHCHWFPENVQRKVWDYFDRHYWAITYREAPEARRAWLHRNGVHRFTTLNYAHKPGMAAWLNEWTAEFAAATPECIPCGTFYPEPGVGEYVRRAIENHGFRGFKLHLRVGDFDPADPALDEAYAQLARHGLPVVIHCGSAPEPGRYTAVEYMKALFGRHPNLIVVVAHMGGGEFTEYLRLTEEHAPLRMDTTMVFVDFLAVHGFPEEALARLEGIAHKLLFGSDFPLIPYPLSHAIEAVLRLPLSDAAKRAVLHDNALALLGQALLPERK